MSNGDAAIPTMKQVASKADVALSSVSRVVNNHPDVSDAMRQRVLEAIEALGYEPNLVASSLRSGSTRTVGFVVSDIRNPLFADFTKGASNALQDAGYSVVFTDAQGNPAQDEAMIRLLRSRRVDGLIVSLADEHRQGTLDELLRLDVPVVLLDRQVEALPGASMVTADHFGGMFAATEHLLSLGHRRIALLSGSRNIRPPEERLAGLKEAFRSHRVPYPNDLLHLESFSPEFGEVTTSKLLRAEDPPTAIIAGGNLLLIGVLRALKAANREVGTDISVISCDDVPLAELHHPSITVIARDTVLMGKIAAEVVLERLLSPEVIPRTVRVPTQLIVRESTTRVRI